MAAVHRPAVTGKRRAWFADFSDTQEYKNIQETPGGVYAMRQAFQFLRTEALASRCEQLSRASPA
jgi:hypothetical protein